MLSNETSSAVAHSSPTAARLSNAVVGSQESTESPPELFSVQDSYVCREPVILLKSRNSVSILQLPVSPSSMIRHSNLEESFRC